MKTKTELNNAAKDLLWDAIQESETKIELLENKYTAEELGYISDKRIKLEKMLQKHLQ